jgi:hypothetical protein
MVEAGESSPLMNGQHKTVGSVQNTENHRDFSEMARRRFGYGRWDAPFWFIGPEEGMDPSEHNDLTHRLRAWNSLGGPELCDCASFHRQIGLPALLKWHRKLPPPPLNLTWKQLMLLLMTFSASSTEKEGLREYQRTRWGMSDGETCVIELSGLAARAFNVPRDRTLFRAERIAVMRKSMDKQKPKLVVMYGWGERHSFKEIAADCDLDEETFQGFPAEVGKIDATRIAIAQHPNRHGLVNAYWVELGRRLRQM